ncbi:hypothetical protein B296_00017364 [Ensete ventricosum]|uniref:Uncharacterized protein n=1 Tax=Ensete ventricosum TaxID=4639 RepID=A0A426Z6T7_ENSVE|nr:hypothetical protein B296_00017364 [Ensete ventricosum]
MHRVNTVGNSLGVHQSRVSEVCQDGTRVFTRGRPRLAGRLSGVAEKLIENDGLRSSLSIEPRLDDVVGSRRSLLGDSLKGLGSSLGTWWEITGRRPEGSPQECRRLPDWRELALDYLDWSLSTVTIESQLGF